MVWEHFKNYAVCSNFGRLEGASELGEKLSPCTSIREHTDDSIKLKLYATMWELIVVDEILMQQES